MNFQNGAARRHALIALLGTTMLATSPAYAQAAAEEEASAGDDIIVTAQKREENLQDVPISVQPDDVPNRRRRLTLAALALRRLPSG